MASIQTERPTLLIDGDAILYRSCCAAEKEVHWDDENHVLWSNWKDALELCENQINNLVSLHGAAKAYLCFTDRVNFRKTIDPTYKSNRKATRRPLCMTEVNEKLRLQWPILELPTLEADDVMGIFATAPGNQAIICSADKDMRTIPGRVWNGKELLTISQAEADYYHLYQTLVGDTADGYAGCPGVGPVKAAKVLAKAFPSEGEPDMALAWKLVVKAYEDAGLVAEDALRTARLARILRFGEFSKRSGEVKIWEAPDVYEG